ncbi:hypothetical protein [Pseudalkalibacillus salsuginis]|uniref:hypothetical protein n=1 Tax=Pseudalkalibacillus salsuginis TaxID=2910972 RepID=UPI001F30D10D|nr:hypothetical protein [Pseudalkalibacillus salsuginis]MCF6409394.1 hypothetical protein [Pseudalkalibacillus salsuginis]
MMNAIVKRRMTRRRTIRKNIISIKRSIIKAAVSTTIKRAAVNAAVASSTAERAAVDMTTAKRSEALGMTAKRSEALAMMTGKRSEAMAIAARLVNQNIIQVLISNMMIAKRSTATSNVIASRCMVLANGMTMTVSLTNLINLMTSKRNEAAVTVSVSGNYSKIS